MKPRLHLAAVLTAWSVGGAVIAVAAVVLFNSLAAPAGPLLAAAVVLTGFTVGPWFVRLALRATCPQCGERCEWRTRPAFAYRCRGCGYYSDTGLRPGQGGGGSL